MTTLFTDLDNTLIYSRRRNLVDDKVCVEYYNNKPLSFMTNTSIQSLKEYNKCANLNIIPITTRARHQFERINLVDFKYALLDNGGILVKDGVVDEDWYFESLSYAQLCKSEFEKAHLFLETDKFRSFEIRLVDDLFIFTKSDNPSDTMAILKNNLDSSLVNVFNQGSKIYVFPNKLSKGNAIRRMKSLKDLGNIISAGDAPLDFSMACESDVFITSNSSCTKEYGSNIIVAENAVFSDEIFDYIGRFVNNG